MSKPKKLVRQRWLVTMMIRHGEYEFYSSHVVELERHGDISAYADAYARTFYGCKAPEAYGDGYLHNGGEVYVEAQLCRRLSLAEYNVLRRFI